MDVRWAGNIQTLPARLNRRFRALLAPLDPFHVEIHSSAPLIEIRSHRNAWKVFEAPGVEPVFPEKRQAISYAENRAWFRSGEIRILDSSGSVERVIPFNDTNRKL